MAVHLFFIVMISLGSAAAYLKRSLTAMGSVAAFVLALMLYIAGGVTFLAALFAFFVSSTILTRYKGQEKSKIEDELYEKTGTRDHVQVFANGGAAFIAALIHWAFPGEASIAALFTAFAACNADTWASEIGVLSKRAPVSILTLKPIDKGISGGVSLTGTIGALGGSFLLAVFYAGARFWQTDFESLVSNSLWILLFGFLGAIVDSIFGAALQPVYRNPKIGMLTEKRYQGIVKNTRIKGFEFFSNDMVNFLSSSIAAGLAFLVLSLMQI